MDHKEYYLMLLNELLKKRETNKFIIVLGQYLYHLEDSGKILKKACVKNKDLIDAMHIRKALTNKDVQNLLDALNLEIHVSYV